MKYEAVFGDQALFDGAPEDVDMIGYNGGFYKNSQNGPMYCCGCTFTTDEYRNKGFIAMRRIIKEHKRWTWEDRKAGRLPEVGCKCVGILGEAIKRVVHVNKHLVAVENEKTLNVCNFTREEFFRNHKPIETPAEKAQRFESEWVESAFDAVMIVGVHSTEDIQRIKNHLRTIYRAQLSGDLAAPKVGE